MSMGPGNPSVQLGYSHSGRRQQTLTKTTLFTCRGGNFNVWIIDTVRLLQRDSARTSTGSNLYKGL